MKIISLLLFILLVSCVKRHYFETTIIEHYDSIDRWQKNGVEILKVDTLKNNKFKVYFR